VAIYNHIKRIRNPVVDGVTIDKSNILMIGNSGVGKCLHGSTQITVKVPAYLANLIRSRGSNK